MKKTIIFITILLCGVAGIAYAQTWQETLEKNFDIVSTFDELQDWTGTPSIGDVNTSSLMPKLLNGNLSKWGYYSEWSPKDTQNIGPWIGNHDSDNDSDNVWSGAKSLILDYGNASVTMGPERLGMYFGDGSPSSGYDDIYVFYMLKYSPEFFARWLTDNNKFTYFPYLKTLVISAGFRAAFDWGTLEQQEAAKDGGSAAQHCYGLNFFIFNHTAQSATDHELKLVDGIWVSNNSGTNYLPQTEGGIAQGTNFSSFVRNQEWFGIEYYVHRGTLGYKDGIIEFSDGKVEMWIYDGSGKIVGHDLFGNQTHIRVFELHRYNRIVLGGNRSWKKGDLAYAADGSVIATPESHLYIDDVIVNGSRIGPTYFALFNNQPVINSSSLTEATINQSYSQTLRASGGTIPYNWAIIAGALPEGLTLNSVTGEISGITTKQGSFIFTVQATDAQSKTANKELILVVLPATRTGDINNDGFINILDLQLCIKVILGIETDKTVFNQADINKDNKVNLLDIREIINLMLGL